MLRDLRDEDLPSTEKGPRSMAQNAVYQYGQAGSVNAMRRGAIAAMREETKMR